MNTLQNIDAILGRHFSGEALTNDERAELEAYKADNGDEFHKIDTLLSALPDDAPTLQVDTDRAWQQVESRLGEAEHRAGLHRLYPLLAVAASLLLFVGMGFWAYRSIAADKGLCYVNENSRDTTVTLPDGSLMRLAPSSSAEYAETSESYGRQVKLRGRAFFDVVHSGRTFRVKAGELRVEVLGTSFTVDATDADRAHVSVTTGRVQVTAHRQTLVLTRGEQVQMEQGRMRHEQQAESRKDTPHVFDFDNTPIRDAVEEVARALDVQITVEPSVSAVNRVTTHMQVTTPMQALREFALLCGCRCDSVSPLRYRLH